MAEQHKRGSMREDAHPTHSGKKLKAQAMTPNGMGVVKQEPPEVQLQAEAEVSPAGGAVVEVATAETMDEPQLNLMFGVSLFHCLSCLRPVTPPTFKCEAAHVVCGTCRAGHAQTCTSAATYAACPEVDNIVRGAKLPCPFSEYGCTSFPVYFQAADHERACQYAPCYCPALDCDTYTSPARLLDHFSTGHGWPVTEVGYGKPCDLAMPAPAQGLHALVGKDDRRVFLVSASPLGSGGATVAVSVVCVCANGDAAPQFRCRMWVESRLNAGDTAVVKFVVPSKDMSGGFVAADQGSFLAVTPDLMRDASGAVATPVLKVRIDKAGGAAAARSPTTPASSAGWLA